MTAGESNIITFPAPSYFGDCPRCGRNDGYLNDGAEHWFICRRHRVKWYLGSNLFSAWRALSDAEAWAQAAELATYTAIAARYRGTLPAGVKDSEP
ncbi:MAG TPA: hypothetical protein VFA70_14370 [Dehalococcoidia bacterium]|jgi:hypothetical protein|nr:hypothetical protein [Dehalococcoidia bacterium]